MKSFVHACRACRGTGCRPGGGSGGSCDVCQGTGRVARPIMVRTQLDPRLGRQEAGDIAVTLYPDSTIGFRKLKRRHEVRLPLAAVYASALKAEAQVRARERQSKKRA